jgi:hypothetical protein
LEPNDVIKALQNEGLPTHLVEKANSWTVHHGPVPNTGYFLISHSDFQNIKNVELPTLTLTIKDRSGNTVEFENLTLTAATNVLGKADTKGSIILIKIEDYRWWMKRIYCGDVKANWVATNDDFNNNYLQVDTTNSGSFYTVAQILSSILSTFRSDANHTSFNNATYGSAATYSDTLNNIDFSGMTVLDALNTLCETCRLNYIIKPNGQVYFNTGFATWPTYDTEFINSIELGSPLPSTITAVAQDREYELFDDRCSNIRPQTTYNYDHTVSSGTINSTYLIRAPYIVQSDSLSNTTVVNGVLATIAARYVDILKARPRISYCQDYVNFHDSINFGLDEVVYFNKGAGMISMAVGKELEQYKLNYTDPPFPVYHADPHGIFLYRFTLKQEWFNNIALSDIFRHDGTDTGYDESVRDPFSIFEDLSVGDSGWCIEVCGFYYAIQAPCYDPSDPAPDPDPPPD